MSGWRDSIKIWGRSTFRQRKSKGLSGKESACNAGFASSSFGPGRYPGEGNDNPLQYSCMENPMDSGAWGAIVHGIAESWAGLKRLSNSSSEVGRSLEPLEVDTMLVWLSGQGGGYGQMPSFCGTREDARFYSKSSRRHWTVSRRDGLKQRGLCSKMAHHQPLFSVV